MSTPFTFRIRFSIKPEKWRQHESCDGPQIETAHFAAERTAQIIQSAGIAHIFGRPMLKKQGLERNEMAIVVLEIDQEKFHADIANLAERYKCIRGGQEKSGDKCQTAEKQRAPVPCPVEKKYAVSEPERDKEGGNLRVSAQQKEPGHASSQKRWNGSGEKHPAWSIPVEKPVAGP
jgi:hypothetical protein